MPDFIIPVARDDLLKRTTPNSYVIGEVCPVRHLRNQLSKCPRMLTADGSAYIIRAFDIFFSILHQWFNVPTEVKEEAWYIVLKGCEVCLQKLVRILESGEGGSASSSSRPELAVHRNAMKMHVYLLCQFVDMFENELNAHAKSNASVKVGRAKGAGNRRGRPKSNESAPTELHLSIDWIDECDKAISVLDQLCRLPIDKLWDPPVAEEDFVNLLANCCYKLLENRAMASSVNMRAVMTRLLASLIRRYGHSIACCVKLTQLLQCFPHMVNCLVAFVRSFMEDENVSSLVRELLKEICSYNGSDLERDTQAMQNFSAFLLEVASAYPALAQSILPLLRPRLDEDPYQMRNCVLSVIGEVLSSFARREHMDPNETVQRDRLMDLLQEHIHDVNGYVRAKALQIWYAIVSTRGLPIGRQSRFAELLVGPLGAMMDVSSFARRYACKALTAMVLQNAASKLTPVELQQVLTKEIKRLDSLEEFLSKVCPYEDNGKADAEQSNLPTEQGDVPEQTPLKKKMKKKKKKKKQSTHKPPANQEETDNEPNNENGEQVDVSAAGDVVDDETDDEDDDGEETDDEDADRNASHMAGSPEENLERPPIVTGGEEDAAAALEAEIHSAVAIAAQAPTCTPLRSTSGMHAQITGDVHRQRVCVTYLREASAFSKLVHTAICDFQTMLASKTLSDVTEAIDFFVTAKHAGVKGLERGIQQIFTQIWSQDEPVRKAVVEAFRKLYLQLDPDEPLGATTELSTETADVIVTNLSRFIREADLGSMVSMERIIQELTSTDQFNASLCSHFWRRFLTFSRQNTPESREDIKSMLLIIKMMVKSNRRELDKHLDLLIQYGLELETDVNRVDMERAKFTCDVLQRMVPRPQLDKLGNRAKASNEPYRLQTNHELFNRLRTLLISGVTQAHHTMWVPMMEQAIGIIYDLAESPELITLNVISAVAEKLTRHAMRKFLASPTTAITTTVTEPLTVDPIPDAIPQSGEGTTDDAQTCQTALIANLLKEIKEDPDKFVGLTCPAFCLSRFFSLAGHVCLKQLVHLESTVLTELKRRAQVTEDRNSRPKAKARKSARPSRISTTSFANTTTLSSTAVNTTINNGTSNTTGGANDDESGLVGVNADDAEAEYIRQICDSELIAAPNHFFTPLLALVTHVCANSPRYPDDAVQASASLALAKMMLINAEVCEPRLQLIFTMAERSSSEIVRANLIVALGDLCRRFPNLLEPWTPHLYARLRDTSATVRTNALNTLSHLILNDMVKVKGQISEMTVCLVEEVDRLNVLARQFFKELARKGTSLYNVVPDIISRLSDPDIGVSEKDFHSIMDFLLPLIGRERLCETLVEKICTRFRTTSLERQWRDLAHCLTVISFNEKSMRILYENIPAFADKLCILEVHMAFEKLLVNAKKFIKPDGMARLEEFEAKVKEFHEKGVADEAAVRRAELAAKAVKGKSRTRSSLAHGDSTRRSNVRHPGRVASQLHRSDEDDGQNEATSEESPSTQTAPNLPPAGGRRRAATRTRGGRKQTRRARVAFSSDEEESQPSGDEASDGDE